MNSLTMMSAIHHNTRYTRSISSMNMFPLFQVKFIAGKYLYPMCQLFYSLHSYYSKVMFIAAWCCNSTNSNDFKCLILILIDFPISTESRTNGQNFMFYYIIIELLLRRYTKICETKVV